MEHVHRRDIYGHGGDIHRERTYTWRGPAHWMEETYTHGGGHTHIHQGVINAEGTYTWRDIQTEGTCTHGGDIHTEVTYTHGRGRVIELHTG